VELLRTDYVKARKQYRCTGCCEEYILPGQMHYIQVSVDCGSADTTRLCPVCEWKLFNLSYDYFDDCWYEGQLAELPGPGEEL